MSCSSEQMLCPEYVVRSNVMTMLVTTVAVHSVRIDHQVELDLRLLKGIDQLESVLEMDIVITRSVCQLQMAAD